MSPSHSAAFATAGEEKKKKKGETVMGALLSSQPSNEFTCSIVGLLLCEVRRLIL